MFQSVFLSSIPNTTFCYKITIFFVINNVIFVLLQARIDVSLNVGKCFGYLMRAHSLHTPYIICFLF